MADIPSTELVNGYLDSWGSWAPTWEYEAGAAYRHPPTGAPVKPLSQIAAEAAQGIAAGARYGYDWLGGTNSLHDFYAEPSLFRPDEIFDDDDFERGSEPVHLLVLKKAADGQDRHDFENRQEVYRTTQFQKHWAMLVRAEFMGYNGTRAEQLCAGRWLRIKLRERDVRESHIASILPMILVLAKMPSEDEEDAYAFEQSSAFIGATRGLSWYRRAARWWYGKKPIPRRRTTYLPNK